MPKRFLAAAVLVACTFALGAEQTLYQIELVPSGKIVSLDAPTLKGTNYLFHQYPTGTLISIRKSTVKQIGKMSIAEKVAANPTRVVPMRDLPFQGPKQNLGRGGVYTNINRARDAVSAANAGTAGRTSSPD